MILKVPTGSKSLSIAIDGKQYTIKDGKASLPDDMDAKTFKHLLTMGWSISDGAAEKKSEELDKK